MSDARPKILVTNDDGYHSPGIVALADALQAVGDVTVVAPETDNSGVGHAISISSPARVARVRERAVPTYRCSGTPADCVVIGAYDLCGGMPALVVSGINRGANLGDDLNYSGTVAAAIEGIIIGAASMAVSLAAAWPEPAGDYHWKTAAAYAVDAARDVLAHGLPPLTLLNINVPNVAAENVRGIRWVRQGRKAYSDRLDRRTDPRGGSYYWLWGSFDSSTIADDTDLAAVRDEFVSITPVSIDRTNETYLAGRLRNG
ncbi:MAG: 5'/3'-nucleotidase SurE [Candidatus Eremiobacteraeota bacterium]|nr:5'/3'-nucleotidase SurE [Candidatus Eremiobacteraeota bacterium]